jgi:uncharacterized Ntn-hydrolase superfamily protein
MRRRRIRDLSESADMGNTVCHTFSVVALDPATGRLGSAVASCYFGVGAVVPHLRQAVGAVNAQSHSNRRAACCALELMATGIHPENALKMALADDEKVAHRQMLAIDVQGRKAAWTGDECIAARRHVIGETCVAAGNMLASESVVEAIVSAMDSSLDVPFGLRLIQALQAGEAEGGDKRGKQAAGVRIVPGDWNDWGPDYLDLRADDSPDPLAELMRLYDKRWRKDGW